MMFTANELAILVPTKDRPEKMREMLTSVQNQNLKLNQLVIIASGEDIGCLKNEFPDLPIDYHHVETKGQIYQRSFGIKKLRPEIKLVCLLDDDVVLLEGSLSAMLDLFNKNNALGAACFNIINTKPFRLSWPKYVFRMVGREIGEVTRAGYNTRITHVDKDRSVQWIIGGAGCWRKEILQEHPYEEWDRGFPENEDVYFSFPLSQKYNFMVCAQAKMEHYRIPFVKTAEFGEIFTSRRFKLARKFSYFSIPWTYWASIGQISENFLRAILNRDKGYLKMGMGNAKAILKELLFDLF